MPKFMMMWPAERAGKRGQWKKKEYRAQSPEEVAQLEKMVKELRAGRDPKKAHARSGPKPVLDKPPGYRAYFAKKRRARAEVMRKNAKAWWAKVRSGEAEDKRSPRGPSLARVHPHTPVKWMCPVCQMQGTGEKAALAYAHMEVSPGCEAPVLIVEVPSRTSTKAAVLATIKTLGKAVTTVPEATGVSGG